MELCYLSENRKFMTIKCPKNVLKCPKMYENDLKRTEIAFSQYIIKFELTMIKIVSNPSQKLKGTSLNVRKIVLKPLKD